MNTVYKYRTVHGIVEYEILNGEFGVDDTLHLRDTSCNHYGDNCEIEVVKCESGDCYQFSKALNANAEEYIYFHQMEKFWATKKEAYVDGMERAVESYYHSIAENMKRIADAEEVLSEIEKKEVRYLTPEMARASVKSCFTDDQHCRIIGTIYFDDGTVGYLTDSNYYGGYDDGDGDRIILIENKETGRIMTENGDTVYIDESDFKNDIDNAKIANIKKSIENNRKGIESYTLSIERLNTIIEQKDTLTIEQMRDIRNGN